MGRRHRAAGRMRRLLGGAVPGVDFLSRSHVYLLEAVAGVLEDDPTLAGAVEVHLAGVFSGADRDVAARTRSSAARVRAASETIALLRSAEALFLPMHELPGRDPCRPRPSQDLRVPRGRAPDRGGRAGRRRP